MEIAKKLQIREGSTVRVENQPRDVELDVETTDIVPELADAVIVFARNRAELADNAGPAIDAARRDRLTWIAYPKAGKLGTDLNRDSLWKLLEEKGIRPVRQVAIDDVSSALRFRPGTMRGR